MRKALGKLRALILEFSLLLFPGLVLLSALSCCAFLFSCFPLFLSLWELAFGKGLGLQGLEWKLIQVLLSLRSLLLVILTSVALLVIPSRVTL